MHAVRMARSEAERRSIYRFRYSVFAEHLSRRDLDGADHQAKTLGDGLDEVSLHFYAGEPDQPVAALTVSPADSDAISPDLSRFLDLQRLAGAAPLGQVVFANWLLVDPAQAGSSLVTALMAAALEQALSDGVELVLTFCRPGLVNFYERLGFEQYAHAADLKGIGLRCPLLLVPRDAARLKALRSPLHRVLRRSGAAAQSDAVRLKLEPLIDMFQASQILVMDDLWIDGGAGFVTRTRPRLFDGLPEDSVRQIMKLTSVISCRPGQAVTRAGETSDDMFLIAAGDFTARDDTTGAERRLCEGDVFGEIEHLSGMPRREAVTSLSTGHIAALKAEALFRWMRQNPEPGLSLSINLARLLATRLAR